MKEQLFFVGAKALFLNSKKQILIAKSNPEELEPGTPVHWDLPGGRLDKGDSMEEALYREVQEELGTDAFDYTTLFDSSISHIISAHNNGEEIRLCMFTYLCTFRNPDQIIHLSSEHTEYKWADITEAKELLRYKFSKEFISKLDTLQ